jgi:hypothetical protein
MRAFAKWKMYFMRDYIHVGTCRPSARCVTLTSSDLANVAHSFRRRSVLVGAAFLCWCMLD